MKHVLKSRFDRRVLSKFFCNYRSILGGNLLEYMLVGVLFLSLTLFMTNFVLLHGTHQLFIDGPGDGTAGFLWFNTVDTDNSPLLGHTDMANFPVGENLQNPVFITYSAILLPLWMLSKLFGPVMGLNIVTFFGFFIGGMSMYWLVKKLTRNPLVAFFAGYAATYTPYSLIKSSSHLPYIFCVVFILILGAFIGFWLRPTLRRAALFAATIALAFYTDGYYLLLGSVWVLLLVAGGLLYDAVIRIGWRPLGKKITMLFVAAGLVGLSLVPMAAVQVRSGAGVNSALSNARGNIAFDIPYYATHVADFLLPSPLNPFLKENREFQLLNDYKNLRSNGSENTTYLGFTLLFLTISGFFLFITHVLRKKLNASKKIGNIRQMGLVLTLGLVALPLLILCMLPPRFTVAGMHLLTLSDVLLHFNISLWRVMSRFYIPLHVMLVVCSAIGLSLLVGAWNKNTPKAIRRFSAKGRVAIIAIPLLCLGLIATEYATLVSRPSYDLRNLPGLYQRIRSREDIKVVAELPLLDRPLSINYDFATAQLVHQKKLINTPLTNNTPGLRTALGSYVAEEIDYAILRGADTIITHNVRCEDTAWGGLIEQEENSHPTRESAPYGSPICAYKVKKTYQPDSLFVQLEYGSFADVPVFYDTRMGVMIYGGDGRMRFTNELGGATDRPVTLRARIITTPGAPAFKGIWQAYQNDMLIANGEVPGDIHIQHIDGSKGLTVHVTSTDGASPQIYQITVTDIVANLQN